MTNCLIKNIPTEAIFETVGNSGKNFPYDACELPGENVCPICLQENRDVPILSEDGVPLVMYCLL